jgi:hypothetical protein
MLRWQMFDYLFHVRMALNVVFEWFALPFHIVEVLGSNLNPEVLGFPRGLQVTARIVP